MRMARPRCHSHVCSDLLSLQECVEAVCAAAQASENSTSSVIKAANCDGLGADWVAAELRVRSLSYSSF